MFLKNMIKKGLIISKKFEKIIILPCNLQNIFLKFRWVCQKPQDGGSSARPMREKKVLVIWYSGLTLSFDRGTNLFHWSWFIHFHSTSRYISVKRYITALIMHSNRSYFSSLQKKISFIVKRNATMYNI